MQRFADPLSRIRIRVSRVSYCCSAWNGVYAFKGGKAVLAWSEIVVVFVLLKRVDSKCTEQW